MKIKDWIIGYGEYKGYIDMRRKVEEITREMVLEELRLKRHLMPEPWENKYYVGVKDEDGVYQFVITVIGRICGYVCRTYEAEKRLWDLGFDTFDVRTGEKRTNEQIHTRYI